MASKGILGPRSGSQLNNGAQWSKGVAAATMADIAVFAADLDQETADAVLALLTSFSTTQQQILGQVGALATQHEAEAELEMCDVEDEMAAAAADEQPDGRQGRPAELPRAHEWFEQLVRAGRMFLTPQERKEEEDAAAA